MSQQTFVSSSVENVESMHAFFYGWMSRQEEVLKELQCSLQSPNSDESASQLRELLDRVTTHYTDYYHAKSCMAHDNEFLLLAPTWLTPLELSLLWIGGFKPGLAFQIVDRFVGPMSDEQVKKIEEIKGKTRAEERELGDELARIQETVVAPPLVEVAKRAGRAVDGEVDELEMELGTLRREMETLVECADFLRFRTVMRVLSVLEIGQSVRFFTALTQFQVQIRRWGTQLEAASPPVIKVLATISP